MVRQGEGVARQGEGVARQGEGVVRQAEGEGVARQDEGVARQGEGVARQGEGVARQAKGVARLCETMRCTLCRHEVGKVGAGAAHGLTGVVDQNVETIKCGVQMVDKGFDAGPN